MKLNRRAFLQFAAGAVGGTLLSPLPWKLADDTAIWSQNWSWRPKAVPGETSWARTICRLCSGGCGIQVRLIDGKRAVHVTGTPDSPPNPSGVCPLGVSGLQIEYASYRVPGPMKRTGKRGDINGFKPISWKDALAEILSRMKKLQKQSETNSVAWINGDVYGSMGDFIRYFSENFGSPNYFTMPSFLDNQKLANRAVQGHDTAIAFDLERAKLVLSFGAPLLEGWGSPVRVHRWFSKAIRSGQPQIIHIDWRESYTAAKANEWIPIGPGTETALALGICHVIIKEGLYDRNFVESNCFGFDDWSDNNGNSHKGFKSLVLKEYSPSRVASITGLDAVSIAELARKFARNKPAVAVWGSADRANTGSFYQNMALFSLNALLGNIDKPGGLINVPSVPLKPLEEAIPEGSERQQIEELKLGIDAAESFPLPGNLLYTALDEMATNKNKTPRILFLYEANPAYSLPEPNTFLKAIERVDLVVSFSSVFDETAAYSDLILPNHADLERWDDFSTPAGLPFAAYGLAKPVLSTQKNTMHTGDLLIKLAKELGGNLPQKFPWKDYESVLKWRVDGIAERAKGKVLENEDIFSLLNTHAKLEPNFKSGEELWEKLSDGHYWVALPEITGKTVFETPSGKFEFYAQILRKGELKKQSDKLFVANYMPLEPSGSKDKYPYLLIPYDLVVLVPEKIANPPFMTKLLSDTLLRGKDLLVQVNPVTAKRAGIAEGKRAKVKTPVGEADVLVHMSQEVAPGIIAIARGLGHSAFDKYISGKGVNANRLTEVQQDPVTGMGTWWATRAQLVKA